MAKDGQRLRKFQWQWEQPYPTDWTKGLFIVRDEDDWAAHAKHTNRLTMSDGPEKIDTYADLSPAVALVADYEHTPSGAIQHP